eukprot:TRINITY_DN710_c0_g1_i2.p1 TRINITY_DN710_c0_g1~~TRINITY_DN710_c0_g1_i2.p1  ORF type:complete len:469 (-),score=99.29 TRINITY_DN710_c0_g1_i2:459-1865(-)
MPSGVFCFAALPGLPGLARAKSISPAGGRGGHWSSAAAVAGPVDSSSSFVARRSLTAPCPFRVSPRSPSGRRPLELPVRGRTRAGPTMSAPPTTKPYSARAEAAEAQLRRRAVVALRAFSDGAACTVLHEASTRGTTLLPGGLPEAEIVLGAFFGLWTIAAAVRRLAAARNQHSRALIADSLHLAYAWGREPDPAVAASLATAPLSLVDEEVELALAWLYMLDGEDGMTSAAAAQLLWTYARSPVAVHRRRVASGLASFPVRSNAAVAVLHYLAADDEGFVAAAARDALDCFVEAGVIPASAAAVDTTPVVAAATAAASKMAASEAAETAEAWVVPRRPTVTDAHSDDIRVALTRLLQLSDPASVSATMTAVTRRAPAGMGAHRAGGTQEGGAVDARAAVAAGHLPLVGLVGWLGVDRLGCLVGHLSPAPGPVPHPAAGAGSQGASGVGASLPRADGPRRPRLLGRHV